MMSGSKVVGNQFATFLPAWLLPPVQLFLVGRSFGEPVHKNVQIGKVQIDTLNRKFGKGVLSLGPWKPPPGGYDGGKISYTRIPSAEDFW